MTTPTAEPVVLTNTVDTIRIITMNRPESRNALNPELMGALQVAVAKAAEDREVRAVILTGAGGAFCSGGDLTMGARSDAPARAEAREALPVTAHTSSLLHRMRKPTIAMIGGPAAGAGLSLAGACDIRIASESAVFFAAFLSAGIPGDYGGTYFWARIVGVARAKEMYLLNEKIDASRALEMGIVNRVVPGDQLYDEAMSVAQQILKGRPGVVARMIQNLNAGEEQDLEAVLELERQLMRPRAR